MAKNLRVNKLLTEQERTELLKQLLPIVKGYIVCESLTYINSRVFKNKEGNSTYHVIGATNTQLGKRMQRITFHEETNSVEFLLHPIVTDSVKFRSS